MPCHNSEFHCCDGFHKIFIFYDRFYAAVVSIIVTGFVQHACYDPQLKEEIAQRMVITENALVLRFRWMEKMIKYFREKLNGIT